MHETGLANRFVQAAFEEATRRGAARVLTVSARIGALQAVDVDHLVSDFDELVRGTPLAGARLVVERVPATSECLDCGATGPGEGEAEPCPACSGWRRETITGLECELTALEIE
jgi:hydrogenase nickel incorporation protein HypA/HybF